MVQTAARDTDIVFIHCGRGDHRNVIVLMDCFGKNLGKQFDCQSL